MIKKVKKFSIGDVVIYDGRRCKITEFPTRYSVCIMNLGSTLGKFFTAKISIRDIKKV